jgi:peptide-methionine (S)-S-oxide reductase
MYDASMVTQVVPAGQWYEAEPYHQEYFAQNPFQGYCQLVVSPKVAKFRKQFSHRLKT